MRKRLSRFLSFGLVLLGVIPVLAAPLPPQSTTVSGVTITATPLTLTGDRWVFEIVLETHSGDLGDDLAKTATLSADNSTAIAPLDWRGDPPGGHHRKGVLEFTAAKPAPANIELRIERKSEPMPRIFRWQLP